jgi:hypothetical protein
MLQRSRLFNADDQLAQATPDHTPEKSLARYLPASLRKKEPQKPAMVVATIK